MAAARRLADAVTLVVVVLLILHRDLHAVQARGFRRSLNHVPASTFKNSSLFPPIFNVAAKAEIYVNATCGEHGPETFCKPSEPSRCAVCDSRSPDAGKRHHISNVLHLNSGRWWQSPTIARGDRYEYVTILLDLKQVYQVEYVIVKAANSPRPAAWILEKSLDGENFLPWQYYAPSDEECWLRYSTSPALGKAIFINDDDIICTSQHSKQTPMENGEMESLKHRHHQECECERHTCGERCEKCCPMYNQIPWRPGTADKGFRCEVCNCNGHATSCRYDQEVDRRGMSMDIHGEYRGGGVCVNCTKHTTGINCETCEVGYYRPNGVAPDAPEPCVPCNCDSHGSTGYCTPDDSYTSVGKVAGACECKPGYSGYMCNQCAAGYQQFPDCMPCPCDSRGILPSDDCEGDCLCKTNVAGEFCDRCKPGYFALTKSNIDGCSPCYCFGRTDRCTSARLSYNMVSTLENWLVTDMNASRAVVPTLMTDDGWLTVTADEVEYSSPFWLAPQVYTGNLISSYGSNLTYSVTWAVIRGDSSGKPTIEPNVILISNNGLRIAYGEEQYSSVKAEVSVSLREHGWYHVRDEIRDIPTRLRRTEYRGDPVTKAQMMRVLADLKHLMIRAKYHSEQIEGNLQFAVLTTAELSPDGKINNLIEKCECPEGYEGLSCEKCAWGYAKVITNSTHFQDHHICVKCDCNGHVGSCDLLMGECGTCLHHTVGPKCDRCAVGYYGIATKGTSEDCKKCACPLFIESNNFSPSCQLDDPTDINSGYVCTQCPEGYTDDHCESCDVGFYGNPLTPGGTCQRCLCNGGACDQETGRCLECRGNTEGWKCDRCKEAHFGDPLKLNCMPCDCSPLGSNSAQCDRVTGQCPCGSLFAGRDCSSCIEGYGNVTAGCRECDCDVGALGGLCDPVSGVCRCAPGVVGSRCDRCDADHYGLTSDGCKGCGCNNMGSSSSACDIVSGQCQCKPQVVGRQCNECKIGYWGLASGTGCASCSCDLMGSRNVSCHSNTGQCYCKPGVGGTICDTCLSGYYGFSANGCQLCDPCVRPGHVCDPDTGRCVCPSLTYGEHCDRCRPGAWNLVPRVGCRPCACTLGTTRPQCDHQGQCPCRIGYDGLRCERCTKGYYGYPRCRPCSCNVAGITQCGDGVCECDDKGQCPCKELVVGRQCDQCKEGTFGLATSNARGCTECFCFGRSALCRQARLSWGQRRLTHPRVLYINETVHDITITNFGATNVLPTVNGGLNVTNGLSVIPGSDGDVTLSSNLYYNYPLYWKLPDSFLGDKVVSYGGFLRFNVSTEGGIPLRTSLRYPLVQMQGNSKIVLEYYLRAPVSDENRYEIRLHESLWQLQNRPDYKVSREVLMVALQNLQHILVKASDNIEFTRTTLLEASLDAAVLTPTHSPSLAIGVEICECPAEYNGTSCQDPSIGYYRWHMNTTATSTGVLDLVGQARRCQCSGRSDVCDRETGYCLNCREYTTGARCDVCADSFYGHPEFGGCRPCPCPQVDKSFSSTCVIRTGNEPICHCKPGYTGRKCEYCSYGYYGSPNLPDGKCVPCNCNLAGSLSDACDGETGQCKCRPGSTGRDCSECTAYRHVYINDVCTTCDDNCTGILLDTVETLSAKLAGGTSHIVDGSILPPWDELAYVNANATEYLGELELRDRLQQRMKNVPWHQHMKLMKDVEAMLRNANIHARHADTLKTRSSDLKNNIFSSKIEIEKLHRNIKDTISQLNQYSSDNKRIGIKKALKTGKMILSYLKSVDISKRTMEVEDFLDEVAEYVAWLNSLEDATEPLAAAQDDAEDYEVKLKDVRTIVEDTMETLFSYDGLYNSINRTLVETKQQCIRIGTLRDETNKSVAEGEDLVDQARGFLVDAENNVQDLPSLRDKLAHWKEKLTMREEILYRLNYEYNQQYVIPAVTHAKNLSNYADQYVSLFAETRDIAASPLKASQAYKNIVDGLKAAKVTALAAKTAIEEVYAKVFPPSERKSLLDEAKEAFSKTSRQWETAKEHNKLVKKASAEVEAQKRAVYTLKDTLNSTGIRDNQINVKLRELQGSSKKFHEDVQNILNENDEVTESIRNKQRLIDDYNQGIADRLRPKLNELKREGDSKISLASEKLTEALSNIKKADAKLISLSNAAMKRKAVFDKWNDTLATKLQNLKDKIAEARNTADGIRVSLKSAQDKQCIRSYRPETLQPSATSSIVMTFALPAGRKDGSLFYLPSGINDDFIALEIVDRRVRFLWNVGGGTGLLTHPEVLESGDPQNDTFWYRIEAERTRHVGKLSVRKQISTSGKYLPVVNSTNSEYGRFDILPTDRVWIGGIPKSQKKPTELIAPNGLAGCVHQVIFDGKQIGLWNFVSTAPDMACAACVEGVEAARDDIAYSFNGKGYAVRNRVSSAPYSKYMFGVSFSFRTYDENALLFLAINPDNNQHIMIYLREGRVILDVGYGGNVSIEMSSTYKYNTGNWTKVDAGRQYQVQKHIEKCSLSIDSDDKRIGAPTPQPRKEDLPNLAQAKYYIGGLPPSFRADEVLPSQVSFLGCMSNLVVQQGYDPMAELYYGVEPSCRRKPLKIVGFYGDGYLEHPAYTLRKKHSVLSFSFRTPQEAAMLLLSTFEGNEDRPSVGNTGQGENNNYYSVCIVNGQVQVRLNAGQGELVLQSNSTFNDGRYHSVTVIKRRKEVELRIDDAYQSTGRLATSAAIKAPSANKGLFFGGLPALINNTKMVTTNTPLYGAIKDVIVNDEILRFDDAINFDHALIGRSGPSMGKDPPSYVPSASLSRGMSTQPEGCQKVPYYSLEPGALKFGDKPHSHTQLYLNFKKFWEKDYVIEFDFRTYYPNGLLFITPGLRLRNYLMVVIQDGQLLLLLKGKQHREMLFKTPFNDGNWHHVVLSREERKLTLLVDTQTPRTLKLPRRAGLASMMYIGGLPENGTPLPDNVVTKLETLKGCIRGLRVNGNVYDMVGSTSRAFNVGQCFPSVESGAYFQDEAYAIYQENFELGAVLELQLEFRTSELSGVLLSISAPDGSPSLALELNNGRVIMSGDLGDNNPLYVEQRFASPYAICDNRWHRIQAVYNDEELALKVDELDQKYGLPTKANYHFADSTTYGPLYIGGIPASAQKGSLITRDHFNGCIRNVMIGGERRDWTDMAELHNIHLSSCPVQ